VADGAVAASSAGAGSASEHPESEVPAALIGVASAEFPRRAASLFWQYWGASSVSSIGDAVTAVALPLTAVELLRASSFEVSWLTAATYAAWVLVGLPAGVITSRLPQRGAQLAMDLLRAAALASIPAAWWAGYLTMGQLVIVALLVGLATVISSVSNATYLPAIVPADQLTARNSLMSGSAAATQLGGPSLGGVLVQFFTAPVAVVADVVSYLISAALLSGLPRPRPAQSDKPNASMVALIGDGLRYVVRHPVIGPCTLCAAIINFVCGALMALVPVFLVRTLGAPAWLVGVLIAAEGLGSLAGAALTPRLAARMGTARAAIVAVSISALAALAMPISAGSLRFALFAVGYAGLAAGVVVLSILTRTYRQTESPAVLFPRVMATVRFISWGVIPFGALAAGAVASAAGNRTAMWLACVVYFGAPLSLLLTRVRRCRDFADGSPSAEPAPS
jgi:predicted MFS family arabinose efflux permease